MGAYRSWVDDLTRGSRERAARAAQNLLATAGLEGWASDTTEKVARLADEVGQASRANRELFEQVVAAEVGRAAGRLGLVPQGALQDAVDQVAALQAELHASRRDLEDLTDRVRALEAARVPGAPLPEEEEPA